MNAKTLLLIGTLLAGCMGAAGCRTVRDDRPTGFLKPLDSGLNSAPGASLGSDLSEREICLETAKLVASNGHAIEAMKLYEKAESLAPNEDRLDLELAPLYVHVGKTDAAITRYRSAIANGKANGDVFNNLAWTFLEVGRHAEAMKTVQEGLAVEPGSDRLQATQAVLLYHRGDREGSLKKFSALYGESAGHHNLALLDLESDKLASAFEHASLAASLSDCSEQSIKLRDTLQTRLATADQVSKVR
ncbi:MAG: tetratricopeptide repeat protein [Planctomycetota bacterium]